MRKKYLIILVFIMALFTACGTKELREEVQTAIDAYNISVASYNEEIKPYNNAVAQIEAANTTLQDTLNAAQDVINKEEQPYDMTTLEDLKTTMANASKAKINVPSTLEEVETMVIPEKVNKSSLESLKDQVIKASEELATHVVPDIPTIPDYSTVISTVSNAKKNYEDSIQSLKQITAPTDDFVMERLQRIDTITAMEAVTEEHDPNGQLNKQGGYIGCIYFSDTQVDRSQLYIEDGKDNVIDIGTDGGGAIEIFSSPEEANVRNDYLASFDGGMFASGSHYVEGTCLIRTSNYLNGTQQKELTSKITEALIAVDK